MLILKTYINKRQIDEIWIHNTGEKLGKKYIYRLVEPNTDKEITSECFNLRINHDRDKGWKPLAKKALELFERIKNGKYGK